MSELRYRTVTVNNADTASPVTSIEREGLLAASTLLQSSPSHHGQVMKLDIPLFYSIAPNFIQRILRYFPSFLGLRPTWKKRYLIQIGKYLYRYSRNDSVYGTGAAGSQTLMKQKGAPIPLDTIQARTIYSTRYGLAQSVPQNGINPNSDDIIAIMQDLPTFCDGYFAISTGGTTRYYAVSTQEDATTWVNSIREGRQSVITRNMGHDQHRPYPKAWEYIDQRGDSNFKRKMRIKDRIRNVESKELEMTEFAHGMSGTMPRGYFG